MKDNYSLFVHKNRLNNFYFLLVNYSVMIHEVCSNISKLYGEEILFLQSDTFHTHLQLDSDMKREFIDGVRESVMRVTTLRDYENQSEKLLQHFENQDTSWQKVISHPAEGRDLTPFGIMIEKILIKVNGDVERIFDMI